MNIGLDNIFAGKTVTIIAGGPSLKGFDFNKVEGVVVCVNNAAYYTKSDMVVSVDKDWHVRNVKFLDSYEGILLTDRETTRKEAKIVEYSAKGPDGVHYDWYMKKANLSGFVALGVVLQLGATTVKLLGFDGGFEKQPNFYDNPHANSEHGYSSKNEFYDIFIGKAVILNYGASSKIESFQKIPLKVYGT